MRHYQKGLTLPTVMIISVLLLILTVALVTQTSTDLRIGGSVRDTELSQNLADATLTQIGDRFVNTNTEIGDINGDGTLDASVGYTNLTLLPTTLPLGYAFYVQGSTTPSILQSVATGESTANGCSVTNQAIDCTEMLINDLFVDATRRPLLFIETSMGLSASTAANWQAETERNKVAVWLEYTMNPTTNAFTDVYIQASAQSGRSKSYIQKFLGTFSSQANIVSAITESATHGDFVIE